MTDYEVHGGTASPAEADALRRTLAFADRAAPALRAIRPWLCALRDSHPQGVRVGLLIYELDAALALLESGQ